MGRFVYLPDPFHTKSAGSSLPTLTSTTGIYFLSALIEMALGRYRLKTLTMTRRSNGVEVTFLRLEANCVSASTEFGDVTEFKNPSVFSEGRDVGFDTKAERSCDTQESQSTVNVSRAGKNDGSNIGPGICADERVLYMR